MSYQKKNQNQEEPRCVVCSTGFYFRDPINPYGAKCPHILQCGHSACEGCLTSALMKSNVLSCPECSTVSEANKFDPKNMKKSEMLSLREDFPLNVYAVGQVSLKRNRPNTGESLIKFCPKNKKLTDSNAVYCNECNERTADCSCRQCGTELCSACFGSIHNSVTLRKHDKISLKEKHANEFFEDSVCKHHGGLYLNIYCKECEIYICKECIVETHLEHHCTDTYQQNEDKLPEFSQCFDEANEVLKHLYATKKKLQTPGTRGQLQDEETMKVERRLQAHYNYLHGLLQRQEEEWLQKVRSVHVAARSSLETVSTDLDRNIKEIENILSISNCILTSNKIKEIPLECLMEKLRNVCGTPCHLVLNDEESSEFEVHIDSTITEAIKSHLTINIPAKRVFELRSKDDLPKSYKIESLENIPDPFLKPDLNLLMTEKDNEGNANNKVQKALLNAIIPPPQTEAKTKPQDFLHRNKTVSPMKKSRSGSMGSVASHESSVDRITKVLPLAAGTSEIVKMIHLMSPNSFYVQRKCNLAEIEKIREYFVKNANRSKNPPDTIEYGRMYLVNYSRDNNWYRGRVLRVDGNFCDIFYVDYGNTETRVPRNKLRDIPEKYAMIPDQALHCGLYNCTPADGQWSPKANILVSSMACMKDLSMYVERINKTNGFHEVHLRTADDTTRSFTDALVYNGLATRTESVAREAGLFKKPGFRIKKNTFKTTVIKEHEVFDGQVTHINTPTHFYMQKISEGGQLLMNLMRDLCDTYSRLGENEKLIFTPTVGMSVAAKFHDGSWYRATVLNVPEPMKVQVKYVDFGNVSVVSIKDIRELDQRFLRIAAQAMKCALHDIRSKHPKGWPAAAKTAFEKLVLNKGLMRVYVEKVNDDNSLSIVLYETQSTKYINISGVLVKRGHAVCTGQTSREAEFACRPELELNHHQHTELMPSDSDSIYSEISGTTKTSESGGTSKSKSHPVSRMKQDSKYFETQDNLDQDIDGRVKVEVLKIMSPSEIWITSGSTPKLIKKLIKDMTVFYKDLEQEGEPRDWTVGDLCAVFNSQDYHWYRGVITEALHTSYKVFIKDTVEVVDVDRSQLRGLDPEFYNVPDGSTKVHLGGLRVPAGLKTWPASTTDYLRRLMEESQALYIDKLGDVVVDSIPVRLWRRSQKQGGPLDPVRDEWCDVNESLVSIGFALADHTANNISPSTTTVDPNDKYVMSWLDNSFQVAAKAPYVSDLENNESVPTQARTNEKRVGSKRDVSRSRCNRGRFPSQRATYIPATIGPAALQVITEWLPAKPFKELHFFGQPTYVDYDCNIYIQDIDSCLDILELLEKAFLSLFENSLKRPHEEEYLEGQICVAYFAVTNKWYRGKVLKVKPEHIEVYFVDYGNVEELQPNELRKQVTMGHIPIQCHKCRTDGIFPVSTNGKWTIQALDFIHGTVVDKRCELTLKAPTETCDSYVILNLKMPGGQDLMETLLSMNYATYFVDCEEADDEEEIIIEDQEIQLAMSNNKTSKALALEIENVCSNLGQLKAFTNENTQLEANEDGELIEDHVKSLQLEENYDWYDLVENGENPSVSPAFLTEVTELDTTPTVDLRYRDMLLPDSMVEFSVEVQSVVSYNAVKVIITECDDPGVMAYIDEFDKMQQVIQEEADKQPAIIYPLKDLVCIGLYTLDDTWYRAVIKDVLPGNVVTVYYVDYGNLETIPLTRLRQTKPEWTLTPVQVIQVTLDKLCHGPQYDAIACQEMYQVCLMTPPYTMVVESRFPSLQVELYNNEGELAYKPLLEAGLIAKENL